MKQIEEMQQGNITSEEMKNAMLSMVNSYRTVNDSNASIESFYLGQILCGSTNSPEEEARQICSITKDEVIWASKQLKLDICYILTGKEV